MTTIAFIGLGHMGNPMAANLVKAGHMVRGFDLVPENLSKARENGVTRAADAAEAVKAAEAVITMLPAGKHVVAVYESSRLRRRRHAADRQFHHRHRARPARRMRSRRRNRLLRSMRRSPAARRSRRRHTHLHGRRVGGGIRQAEPILQPMAGRIVHCGDAGAGQAAKICNNMILGISMIGVAEAFVLAEKIGLSHQAMFDVASTSSGQCWSLTSYCPVPGPVPASPANRDYKPGFAAALMLKDLKLAQEAAGCRRRHAAWRAAADLYAAFQNRIEPLERRDRDAAARRAPRGGRGRSARPRTARGRCPRPSRRWPGRACARRPASRPGCVGPARRASGRDPSSRRPRARRRRRPRRRRTAPGSRSGPGRATPARARRARRSLGPAR